MTRNHDADAPSLDTAPRVLLVGEAPPKAGLGPLGAFDCIAGERLAVLDPHHEVAFPRDRADPRWCLEQTLGLFDRVNLLATFPGRRVKGGDEWPELEAVAAAAELLPEWVGRRVALAGRRVGRAVAKAGGFALAGVGDGPLCRWVELGGPGEPEAVCVVPHPSPTNRELNPGKPAREALGRWLAGERARLARAAEWVRLGPALVYRYSDGAWLGPDAHPGDPAWRARTLRELAVNTSGLGRFTGRGMSVVAHHLLVDDLAAVLDGDEELRQPRLAVEALTHDLREGAVLDVPPMLKRRHPGMAADERTAAAAVDRLLGLPPAPAEVLALVHRADLLAREVEAFELYEFPLEDMSWDRAALGDMSRWVTRVRALTERDKRGLVIEWSDRLGSALAQLGQMWYQEST